MVLSYLKPEGEAFDPNIHQAVVQDDNPILNWRIHEE